MLKLFLKRVWDVVFSLLCLVLSLPLWVLIPLAIYLEDGLPVFFSDLRVGRDKKTYRHLKFRSMVKQAEDKTGPVLATAQDKRITRVGRILRATAMDELPQLMNILKGNMSFVGPRSERPFFIERFIKDIPNYEKRFQVRPGLTGMAQFYGKYDTPPEKKLQYDLGYIEKMDIFLDMKLIFLSFLITLRGGWARFEQNQKGLTK